MAASPPQGPHGGGSSEPRGAEVAALAEDAKRHVVHYLLEVGLCTGVGLCAFGWDLEFAGSFIPRHSLLIDCTGASDCSIGILKGQVCPMSALRTVSPRE